MAETRETFEGWAILELMGHRRLAGFVSEQDIAGSAFVRIDVPGYIHTEPTGEQDERGKATQFYSPQAVYCITPTTEQTARATATASSVAPFSEWELRRALPVGVSLADETDLIDDGLGF